MSGRPWYKRYGGDFVLGTMSLTLEEKGAYSLCLDLIYDRGGPIPDDARWLAGVCGVSLRKWTALRDRLITTGKIVARDGHLTNDRAEKEIENALETSRKHAENGAKGGRTPRETNTKPNQSNGVSEAGPKPNQKPEARHQKKEISDANASSGDGTPPGRDEVRQAFDVWNVLAQRLGLPLAKALDAGRRKAIRTRLADGGLPAWTEALQAVEASAHCRGDNDRQWRADLDFVCQRKSWLRLREGFYGADAKASGPATALPQQVFPGPAPVRAEVLVAKDESWARSYIDRCQWRDADKAILCPTQFVADKLIKEVPGLTARGAKIMVGKLDAPASADLLSFTQPDRKAS